MRQENSFDKSPIQYLSKMSRIDSLGLPSTFSFNEQYELKESVFQNDSQDKALHEVCQNRLLEHRSHRKTVSSHSSHLKKEKRHA